MGFDCEAVTVIGLRVPVERVEKRTESVTKVNHTGCKSLNEKAHKHCPDCGKLVYEVTRRTEVLKQVGKYEVYQPWCNYGESQYAYICVQKSIRKGPRSFRPDDNVVIATPLEELARAREEMRTVLTPAGVWADDGEFGVYTLICFGN